MKHSYSQKLTLTLNVKEMSILYNLTSLLQVHCCEVMLKDEKKFVDKIVKIIEERR